MTIETKAFGKIEIDETQRLRFPRGLLGFEKFKEFALLKADREPFFHLQSLDMAEISFILIDPFLFRPDYELDVSDAELEAIKVKNQEDVLVFAIVTIPASGTTTANLMGPLVINKEAREGFQAILSDSRWQTKHDILRELAETRKASC